METIVLQTASVAETQSLAAELAKHIPRPALIALTGQLGAGKTHFIKGLGQALGIDPRKICSATFVIVAEYGQEIPLIHVDAYRLKSPAELESIGWEELLEREGALVAVEWADKLATLLPPRRLDVRIDILDDHRRRFTFTPHGCAYETALENLSKTRSSPVNGRGRESL